MTWNSFIIAAVFRSGKRHSNHGDTVIKEVRRMVKLIRKKYLPDVPILLRTDTGFLSEKNLKVFDEELKIGFICSGKIFSYIEDYVRACPQSMIQEVSKGKQTWQVLPFGHRYKKWKSSFRALYCSPLQDKDGQGLLRFARPDTLLLTNLGKGVIDEALIEAGYERYLEDEWVLELAHQRGSDELVHRALKDFGTEQLPFQKFQPNTAYYLIMVLAYNLFESFKEDVTADVLPQSSYASTVRRKLFDVAGKLVRKGGQVILKITRVISERLDFASLWQHASNPPLAVA